MVEVSMFHIDGCQVALGPIGQLLIGEDNATHKQGGKSKGKFLDGTGYGREALLYVKKDMLLSGVEVA